VATPDVGTVKQPTRTGSYSHGDLPLLTDSAVEHSHLTPHLNRQHHSDVQHKSQSSIQKFSKKFDKTNQIYRKRQSTNICEPYLNWVMFEEEGKCATLIVLEQILSQEGNVRKIVPSFIGEQQSKMRNELLEE
jgi:hypothetical protein